MWGGCSSHLATHSENCGVSSKTDVYYFRGRVRVWTSSTHCTTLNSWQPWTAPWKAKGLQSQLECRNSPVLCVVWGDCLGRRQRTDKPRHLRPHLAVHILRRDSVVTRQQQRCAKQTRPGLLGRQEVHVHPNLRCTSSERLVLVRWLLHLLLA